MNQQPRASDCYNRTPLIRRLLRLCDRIVVAFVLGALSEYLVFMFAPVVIDKPLSFLVKFFHSEAPRQSFPVWQFYACVLAEFTLWFTFYLIVLFRVSYSANQNAKSSVSL